MGNTKVNAGFQVNMTETSVILASLIFTNKILLIDCENLHTDILGHLSDTDKLLLASYFEVTKGPDYVWNLCHRVKAFASDNFNNGEDFKYGSNPNS